MNPLNIFAMVLLISCAIIAFILIFSSRKDYSYIISNKELQDMSDESREIVQEFFAKNPHRAITWGDFYAIVDQRIEDIRQEKISRQQQKSLIR